MTSKTTTNNSDKWAYFDVQMPYMVSDQGQVWSVRTGTYLKPYYSNMYLWVTMWIDGVGHTRSVHSLVAQAFVANKHNYRCVNHLDGDKLNNTPANLQWCTHKQNTIHALSQGVVTGRHASKLRPGQRRWIRGRIKRGDIKYGISAMARRFDVTRRCIDNICR